MPILDRTGAAPISWGICEVPGWGQQLPASRVLSEMSRLGFRSTELGPKGYLPTDPGTLCALLDEFGLTLSGSFEPLVLHNAARLDETADQVRHIAALLASAGARTFISCPVTDLASWTRPDLDSSGWSTLFEGLRLVDDMCSDVGLQHVVHPHVNSLIETAAEIQRVVDHTQLALVLDTGHFAVGGYDPFRFAADHFARIGLVHLKDLNRELADALNRHDASLLEAVQNGLFPALGAGDLLLRDVIGELVRHGYEGRFVLEQDVAITGDIPPLGAGPVTAVETSLEFLRQVEAELYG